MTEFKEFKTTDPAHADVLNEKIVTPGNELRGSLEAHEVTSVINEEGAHDLRIIDNVIEYKVDGEWENTNEKGVYGVRWNQTKDTYERLGDAAGKDRSFFDDKAPWAEVKRLNLSDEGEVLAFLGDPTYTADGTNGQVMVQFLKYWYKVENYTDGLNNIYDFWISDGPKKDFKIHPGFISGNKELTRFYLSAYEGSVSGGMLQSVTNSVVESNITIEDGRTLAQARGAGWEQQTFTQTCAIQLLYLVEYADFNSQSTISDGRVSQPSYSPTGLSDALENESGGDSTFMSYRGVENFWGNYYKWIDGINFQDGKLYIANHDFESDKFGDNYKDSGIKLPPESGYVRDINYNSNVDYTFTIMDGDGTTTSHIPDYQYANFNNERVARFGGGISNGARSGAFSLSFQPKKITVDDTVASRITYISEAQN